MTRKLPLLALAALAASIPALAQASASASASVTATIVAPLTITKTTDLVFGRIVPGTSPGSVTIAPGGTASPTNVTLLSGITRSAATFNITGNAGDTYYIDLPAASTLTAGGSNSMNIAYAGQLDGTGAANLAGTINPTMPAGGSSVLTLGATLQVSNTQAAGSYSGSAQVTVRYQ